MALVLRKGEGYPAGSSARVRAAPVRVGELGPPGLGVLRAVGNSSQALNKVKLRVLDRKRPRWESDAEIRLSGSKWRGAETE